MRIGIVGTHGVGKSTLVSQLAMLLRIPPIEEQARVVHGEGFELNEKATMSTQLYMLFKHFNKEDTFKSFVSDRTPLDYIAYASLRNRLTKIEQYLFWEMRQYALTRMNLYDFIVYVPIEFGVEDDGVRSMDESFRSNIDSKIQNLLGSINNTIVTVTGSVQDRLDQIASAISSKKS